MDFYYLKEGVTLVRTYARSARAQDDDTMHDVLCMKVLSAPRLDVGFGLENKLFNSIISGARRFKPNG